MVPALNKAVRVGACNSWSLLRPPSLRATGQNRVSIPPCPTSHREPLSSFSSLASKRVRSSPLKRPATLSRTVRNPSQFRHCSTHRRMCRDQGDIGGSMAAAGREVLPANVKAAHYDLTLEPDFKEFTFEGSVRIDLEVQEDTTSIVLNTLELDIKSATISSDGTEVTSSPKITYDEPTQRTTFSFDKKLSAGSKAQVDITFIGSLNDKLAGFYRSSYKHPDGTTHYLATTQMEPTDARRAFPCFDEPALKSTYTVTLISDKDHTCLSNMDVASEKEVDSKIAGGKRKAVTFNKTPLMSTYLLAFIIGELNYIETDKFRLPVRVYAPPSSNIEHGHFSLELAAKTLAFYEETFDSQYPLPKMDMVAIPDFSAGAMENWGLITYRSVDLLFDEKTSGASTKQRVAEVVQHELAHQWFGNLVTMDFWDGLWLNEGFATWMSWYACNTFFPEWKIWQGYVTDNLAQALSLDALRSSHPIEVPIKRADQVNEIFDAISYSKGSAVLRMLSKYLGEETFMDGVRRYIKKHAYGNTRTEDLWASLAAASGKPVESVMGTWTRHVGYPVLTVTEDPDKRSIQVKQNRFLKTADVKPEEDQTLYPVFLELRTRDGVRKDLSLTTRLQKFEIGDLDFFKLNADQSGLYRTAYTPERLTKLGKAAKEGLLSVEDRAGLLADAGALAASGYSRTSGTLALVQSFGAEEEYVVWEQLLANVAAVRSAWKFQDPKVRDALKTFQRNLVAAKAHALGWTFAPDEPHITAQFKALLFSSAGLAGDPAVVAAARDMFSRFAAGDRGAVHPNLRGSVYGIVISRPDATDQDFDILLHEFKNSADADERNTALRALGRVKNPHLIKRTIALPLSDAVRNQDIYLPLVGLRSEPAGVDALWHWMTGNWAELRRRCPPGLTMLGTVVKICTGEFATPEQLKTVEAFFAKEDLTGYKMALEQSLDGVRARIGWVGRDAGNVREWLEVEGLAGELEKL